ncbi:eCIS core domain-containing protein [Phytohabitans sp. LJ34]|uniref:eCIS core domain-containing protein n=1 Tax=Phytohabitans sp. LJ34 TaxID=3452217 RepID=UPI003F8CB004
MRQRIELLPEELLAKKRPDAHRAPAPALPAGVSNRSLAAFLSGPSGGRSGHRHVLAGLGIGHGVAAETPRIFDEPKSYDAAARLGAHAFSWRGDVYLGRDLGRPGAPSRADALRHELAHAGQARRTGTPASTTVLEREAHTGGTAQPANPDVPLGLWWLIPIAVGGYILLRPKVANAPGPGDKLVSSPSDAQIVGEALALFAVPGGVAGALGRAGYGVVTAYAIGGAASTTSFRAVQDVGEGEFSGVEAYVVDATTGAIIGVVAGGVVRLIGGPAAASGPGSERALAHFTTASGETGITSSGVLRGSQGIYALPESATSQGTAVRVLRTLVSPSNTRAYVGIPKEASGLFTQPVPVGPVSLYQRLAGVYRAPAGSIELATGAFTPSGNALANITGQFWPYGVDAMIWVAAGAGGSMVSPASEGAYDRGLLSPVYDLVGNREPLPETSRTDGPFIFVDPYVGGEGTADIIVSDQTSALASLVMPPAPGEALVCEAEQPPMDASAPPGLIFVVPLSHEGLEAAGNATLPNLTTTGR